MRCLWRAVLVAACLAVLVPSPALARATTSTTRLTTPINAVVSEPCLGETVTFTGELRSLFRYTLDANGVAHVSGTTTSFATGVGVSGTRYIAPGASHVTNVTDDSGATPRVVSTNTFLFIGVGGAPNFAFRLTQVFVLDANGAVRADAVETSVKCLS